jgi:hypothetical protein
MKKNGTAPLIDCGLRATNDGAGAPPGALAEELNVIVVPAVAPAPTVTVALCPLPAAGTFNVPPPVGTLCVLLDATGVAVLEPPPQLATIKPPLMTTATVAARNAWAGENMRSSQDERRVDCSLR